MKKLVCLLLVFVMLFASLVACGDGSNIGDGGEKGDNWANLDFGGATLTVSVSKNDPDETTFQNSAVYMKGPDNAGTAEPVQKMVLERNNKVCTDLDMKIEYQETNWRYNQVLADLEKLVAGAAEDAPDVYNNDMRPLYNAMLNGYLWNITNPGKNTDGSDVKSYFEFDHECWYKEYMEGATFSKDKLYILVGDYNIDIVRWAFVLFVNVDRWDATFGGYDEDHAYGAFRTYEDAATFIEATSDWYYDDIIALAGAAHIDGANQNGIADLEDEQIGILLNALSPRLFTYGSGYSIFEWTKNGKTVGECEGVPSLITDTTDLAAVGEKFTQLYNAKGVYNYPSWDVTSSEACVNDFIDGKALMATATLGEMESSAMRGGNVKTRGILPYPRYSDAIDHMTTIVHDQAEVSVILNNAKSFALASAYLQYVNEESTEILDFYYEDVLKFKYNDSRGARKMIDLITDNVTSPFEALLNLDVSSKAGATGYASSTIKHMFEFFEADAKANRASTLRSKYDAQRGAMQTALEGLYAKFNTLE